MKLWLFALLAGLEIAGEITQNRMLVVATKPLLMPALAYWFHANAPGAPMALRRSVLAALLFSCLGDTLLMFVSTHGQLFFLLGLGAFLLAHIFYIRAFLSRTSLTRGFLHQNLAMTLPFGAYLVGLLGWLWAGIPADMQLPVAVYGATITCMALTALNLKGSIPEKSWQWLFAGAALFVVSDSLIAVNKFGEAFAGAGLAIMLTYIVGQYLIVRGIQKFENQ